MDDNGPKDEVYFSHTGTADGHFLLTFFEEKLMEFLKTIMQNLEKSNYFSLFLNQFFCEEGMVATASRLCRRAAR